jgi:endonuclease-3 related protein
MELSFRAKASDSNRGVMSELKFRAPENRGSRGAADIASGRSETPKTSNKTPQPFRPRPNQPPLDEYYRALFSGFGPQRWWPGETQFEVIVGAIFTQNTSWTNVERAIANLREGGLLTPAAVASVSLGELQERIRSSGYFRQKALKLKAFCEFLRVEYGGSLEAMFATPTPLLREKLLGVFGIGPETADSILLYAGQHGVFVVDAYTKRMLARHGWIEEKASYEDVRALVEAQFPGDVARFNELHALIVNTGKQFCRTREPLCHACPLGPHLREGR